MQADFGMELFKPGFSRRSGQGKEMSKPLNQRNTIMQMIHEDTRFSALIKLLESYSHLKDKLDDPEAHLTFFAPTNQAFRNMMPGRMMLDEKTAEQVL